LLWYDNVMKQKEMEKQLISNELALLRSQINPQFLFNTLTNIKSLIALQPEKAIYSIENLSEIMNYMLYETSADKVLLQDEIDYINNYLNLQSVRYDKDFISFEVTGVTNGLLVPPLIFMPFIEKTYRIKPEKRYRAISGLSMGGGGTFVYALHHPELFSSACPLSASTGPRNLEELSNSRELKGAEGIKDSDKEAYFRRYSVLSLIENIPDDQKKAVRWYIDCGDDDFLFEGNSLAHIAMRKKEIPHEFRVRNGAHNWTYWRESLPKVLEFISMAFHQF